MKQTKAIRYILAIILILIILAIAGTYLYNYHVKPTRVYVIDYSENYIEDGGFENFNQTAGDCCNIQPGNPSIFASRSNISYKGNYSLNLTSHNHCACIKLYFTNFSISDIYLLNFYYIGNNPKICNWVGGDNKCMSSKEYNSSFKWNIGNALLYFTELSTSSYIYLYADNRQGQGVVTNLYDDLQVHRLIPIENPSEYEYNSEEEYIFKTKADNNIHNAEMISEIDAKTGEAHFITKGKPSITIKFPWSEVAIVIIMMLIVVRLLFKKKVLETEKEIKGEINQIIKDIER